MQELSTYLLEVSDLSSERLTERSKSISDAIVEWLSQKGVIDPTLFEGAFNSLTANGNGKFVRERTSAVGGSLDEVRLEEFSRGGQTFTTMLSVAHQSTGIAVFVTLSVTNTVSVIAPVYTDPRCPSIVRKLLSLYPDWALNGNALGQAKPLSLVGEEGAQRLTDQLRSEGRLLPIVVVSENDGETSWPKLDEELAYDLAGLAHVVAIDDEASWLLTEEIGKENSCYLGAVRLYWPVRREAAGKGQFPGTVWTASSLLSNDHDGKGLTRFRSAVRHKVMSVAALTIVPPPAIREIKGAVVRRRLQELQTRADANTEELELARLYVEENEQLKADLVKARSEMALLSGRAEMAEYALGQLKAPEALERSPLELEVNEVPLAGEVRFYKKMHSKPVYDVLVPVDDCGHASWQGSAKADKAKKGLEKLVGRNDWKSVQHCGTCTGGGMWKVRW